MKNLSKEELVKQIKSIFNDAQNQINKLITDNGFIYFGSHSVNEIKDLKEEYDWLTVPFEKFFKHFDSLTHCASLTLMQLSHVFSDENSVSDSRKLDEYLMSSEEKQEFISQFENSQQDRVEKQKKIDKLYQKIEAERKKLQKMKDEYNELTGGKQYYLG